MTTDDNPPAVCGVDDHNLRNRIISTILIGLFLVGMGIWLLVVGNGDTVTGIFCVSFGGLFILVEFIFCCRGWYLARHS